ncbi:Nif3-like dinuclear metal center hexameric protein [Aestuariibacter sp. P117]|uniref:Nif3-like dinuclear metal center hexameric protein n=1 Tax=Glaciecola petra TaxID=3075602 RepID=A0ABU2ZQY0_9ALTE|nr:Nif3-like dinuclear metal center hexameric protein [Aestuariibacter sp. P117]MDT0594443.1 Nif3-like dinuclear metal center hexameric protein [Aestuariibacter sp. P117]
MLLQQLIKHLNELLNPMQMHDYCPNGLQVEGNHKVNKIVTGVTASEALIDAAIEAKADLILVHHGYFWKGENPIITGMKKKRLQKLLAHNISLLAYHLPIDVHPELGNNMQLGLQLGCINIVPHPDISPKGIVMLGDLENSLDNEKLCDLISDRLNRRALGVGENTTITKLAWCTGGGQSYIDKVATGSIAIDAYISGEISEQTTHSALEQDIVYFAAGHHATERYGVKAVGEWISKQHKISVQFIDIDNPA